MPMATDVVGGAGAATLGNSSHGVPARAAGHPAETAALPTCQVVDSSSAPEAAQAAPTVEGLQVAPGGLPVSACDVVSHTQLQESPTGSPGWSTLTAGSSSGSVGSEQLGNLVQEHLQARRSSGPEEAALPVAEDAGALAAPDPARPATGFKADAGEPAGSANECALQQAHEQLEHQLARSSTQGAEEQQQADPTAGPERGVPAGRPEAGLDGAAGALLAPADEAAAALVTSEQRLQQLLSQDDDAVLLMAFALKLDRLGRTYKGPSQVRGAHVQLSATTQLTSLQPTLPLPCCTYAHILSVGN